MAGTAAFTTGRAGTAVAFAALTAFALGTFAAGSALAALGFNVALGLLHQGTHRQTELAGLLIDLDEFDVNFITFLETRGSHVFEAFPGDFRDVEQTVAVGHEFDERAEVEDAAHGAAVGLALFGKFHDGVDHFHCLVDGSLVGSSYLDVTAFGNFVDRDSGARGLLNTLDDFSARANDSTDELLGNEHGDDAGHVGLVVLAGCGNGLVDDAEDVETTVAGLHKGLFEDFIAEAVALDVHLGGGDAVLGAGHLEVHVAEVVLVTENIAEDGIFRAVRDKAHGDAGNGLLHLHAGVEQSESASAYGGHRRRTVRLEDVADDAANIGEVIGEHALDGAVGQVAVTDFTTAYTTLGTSLAG